MTTASPTGPLSEALAARSRAASALDQANRDLAQAIREANAAGLKGDHLADALGMTRANVSYLLSKYGR